MNMRGAAACLLLLAYALASGGGTGMRAAPSLATTMYDARADRYSLRYPSSWYFDQRVPTIDFGKVEQGIAKYGIQIQSPDNLALAGVITRPYAASASAIKAVLIALLAENPTIVGNISWSSHAIHGAIFLEGTAMERVGAAKRAMVYVLGASRGRHTYYLLGAVLLKQKTSALRGAELESIFNSIRLA
jgi:hypothetical protein